MGAREQRIRQILTEVLRPTHLQVENESHSHSVPKNSETHFKVLAVAEIFRGLSRLDRQRKVNECLAEELKTGLHALTQRLLTPEEWELLPEAKDFVSPACHGGSKREGLR